MKLEPKDIHERHSKRLDDHAGNSWASGVYVTNNIVNAKPQQEGLTGLLMGDHPTYAKTLFDNTEAAKRIFEKVSQKQHDVYLRYEAAEDDNTVKVNDVFVNLGTDPAYKTGPYSGHGGQDVRFPAEVGTMRRAVPMEGIPEWAMMIITLGGDLISPSWWLLQGIKLICGTDPLEWVTKEIVGDFAVISQCGDAIKVVGEYYTQVASLLRKDNDILFSAWQGDAADSAAPYFRELADLFDKQVPPIKELAALYEQFAWVAFFGAKAIYQAVSLLLDEAIMAIVDVIALAMGISTGPGEVGIAAVLAAWNTAVTVHGIVVASCFALVAVIAGAAAACQSVSLEHFKEA